MQVILSTVPMVLVVGHLYWWLERPKEGAEDEENVPSRNYLAGVGLGCWWSAVTLTTVGYGDVTPKTKGGKILTFVWMIASLFVLATFTGGITAALTSQMQSGPPLQDLKVHSSLCL